MKNLLKKIVFAVSLMVANHAAAQVVTDPFWVVTGVYSDPFADVTGSLSVFDANIGHEAFVTVYKESDGRYAYSANFICKMKKGEILYYTDLNGSSASGVFNESDMSLTIDSAWIVKMCYFDEEPVADPDIYKNRHISRSYLKYYRASGETGYLNDDYFLGNVSNAMWLVAHDDSYVMFAGRMFKTEEEGFDQVTGELLAFHRSFSLQHIGHFNSFELYPSDGIHKTFAAWLKDQGFSSKTKAAEIIFKLSNDISCHAVDTYNRTINLDCPQFAWSVDLEKGTATYTPYFAPKQGASYMLTGDPQLCNLTESAPTNKTIRLWGADAGEEPTGLDDVNNSDFSVSGGSGSVTLSGVSNPACAFSLSGVKVLDAVSDGKYSLAPGIYVIQSGAVSRLVTVR